MLIKSLKKSFKIILHVTSEDYMFTLQKWTTVNSLIIKSICKGCKFQNLIEHTPKSFLHTILRIKSRAPLENAQSLTRGVLNEMRKYCFLRFLSNKQWNIRIIWFSETRSNFTYTVRKRSITIFSVQRKVWSTLKTRSSFLIFGIYLWLFRPPE